MKMAAACLKAASFLFGKGLNASSVHMDFMFGTADLSVVGTRANGTTLEIMKNGLFTL